MPPPYSVATSLPTYDESEKDKAAAMAASAAEVMPRVRKLTHCSVVVRVGGAVRARGRVCVRPTCALLMCVPVRMRNSPPEMISVTPISCESGTMGSSCWPFSVSGDRFVRTSVLTPYSSPSQPSC